MAEKKNGPGKPNFLVMWGDDIGQANLSCYTKGLMGYHTPNIDRIANEGMIFTDSYAEQSCTAGRASFITGQCGLRTGMTKVGLPGAELGLKAEDITIAEALKPLGYRTGQFGKNHLGDRDEHLPTVHGFDEFFGNLYHLNAEEEPEQEDYPDPKEFPDFRKKYGPRGVLHCWADGKGGQKIDNTGPLTKKRMETVDLEFLEAAKKFIKAAHDAGEPFFVWFNATHMHAFMVRITGGKFMMGSDRFYPEEKPVRQVTVDSFYIDKYAVTNEDYKKFVEATGYVTVAERPLNPEDYPGALPELLVPGALVFQKASGPVDLSSYFNWWAWVPGASWRHPQGPGSSLAGREKHPVVHLAYEDAEAYATWAGKELPTEAEWEYASRGGLDGKDFTWGDEDIQLTKPIANTWQGSFPHENLLVDGFEGTSPVGSFEPNGYGLYDMAGNVWEWTSDWYVKNVDESANKVKSCCTTNVNPRVVSPEKSFDECQPDIKIPRKVIKGGSHLCAPNYCLRYRPAARQPQMIDTGMSHLGFRCIVRKNGE